MPGAIFRTILKPRGAKFNVTAKDETLAENYISPIYKPLFMLFLLMLAGVVALAVRWIAYPGDRSVLGVVGTWAMINMILVSLSLRAVSEKQQRRTSPRVDMAAPTTMWWDGSGNVPLEGVILNASTSGARVQMTKVSDGARGLRMIKMGETLQFCPRFADARHLETPVKAVVRKIFDGTDGPILGLLFLPDQAMAVRETVAFLIFGSSENWLKLRQATRTKKGLLAGLGYVVWLSLSSLPKTLADFAREPARRRRDAAKTVVERRPAHLVAFGADFSELGADWAIASTESSATGEAR